MHLPQSADLRLTPAGAWLVALDPGKGTAPDLRAVLRPQGERPAAGPWMSAFASYEEMLAYCVPQDRALTVQPWHAWATYQEIRLEIPLADCQPLAGEASSRTAQALVGDAEPFSFLVPDVFLRFDAERHDRWPKKW